jgi:hypothetical protein
MVATFFVCNHTGQSILDVLETLKFNFGETEIERVAIIKFGMDKCRGYSGCSFQVKIRPYATKVPNMIEAGFAEGRNLMMV